MTNINWNEDDFELEAISELAFENLNVELVPGNLDLPPALQEESSNAMDTASAAADAQAAAQEAIDVGDYVAAAHHREIAEQEAWDSGTNDALTGASSIELTRAAELQERAAELEQSQAENARNGDYAAARDDAANAAYELKEADQLAGGSDHSGTAQLETTNMEWADWHQQIGDDMLANAVEYAADGNVAAAENSLNSSINQHSTADDYGDRGEHGGPLADVAPVNPIESNDFNSYTQSSTLDTSSSSISTTAADTSSSISSTTTDTSSDTSSTIADV